MSSMYRVLLRNLCTSVQSTAAAAEACTEPAVTKLRSITKSLYRENDFDRLVEKFKKASEIDRFRTNSGIYETMVRRLASAKRFNLVEEILEEQTKYKDITKEGFSARLIRLYGVSGMFENAHKLFDGLPERNCTRTVLSFNALLAAYLHSKKFDMVDRLFKELPSKLSIEPDSVSYNTVIKAFCEMGSFDSAFSMIEEMENKGVKPDLITYNTLLDELYGKGRYSEGERIWSEMEKKNVTPDIRSYNARLVGLAGEKKMKEAVELIEKMRNEGVKPDRFSINAVIKGFVDEKNLDEAKKWYSEIANTDCEPNKTTFKMLIPFLCEKGDLKTAIEVCKVIFNSQSRVDDSLLQLVVDRLVKESMVSEAKEIVELGRTCRYKLKLPADKPLHGICPRMILFAPYKLVFSFLVYNSYYPFELVLAFLSLG
ncbi:pentatricopeptide repeat-containing protein [Senna tora]|uniref:Pentatricopeptide repeat-containing protein n=1 Tax=Senna tora TaxID=362788 RepID=A0A834SEF2_9FABA|nr:pentatricopeptide repeat-containing protein [Senna tora]